MVNKDLKRLSRRELVDIIYQLKKNEEQLQSQVAALEQAVEDKRLRIAEAGSIADAAVAVTEVFAAAQSAAELYLQEIACMKAETQAECEKMIQQARETAAQIISDSEKQLPEETKN